MKIFAKRLFLVLILTALSLGAAAQKNGPYTPCRAKIKALGEKYEDEKNGIEGMVCEKGSGLELMKLMLRKEYGKDFIKGVNIIVLIDFGKASENDTSTLISQIEQIAKSCNLEEKEIPEEIKEGSKIRTFITADIKNNRLNDMIVIFEDKEDKGMIYFSGNMISDDNDD